MNVFAQKKLVFFRVFYFSIVASIIIVVVAATKRSDLRDMNMFCAGLACVLLQFGIKTVFFSLSNTYFASGIIPAQVKPSFAIVPALRLLARYCSMENTVSSTTLSIFLKLVYFFHLAKSGRKLSPFLLVDKTVRLEV